MSGAGAAELSKAFVLVQSQQASTEHNPVGGDGSVGLAGQFVNLFGAQGKKSRDAPICGVCDGGIHTPILPLNEVSVQNRKDLTHGAVEPFLVPLAASKERPRSFAKTHSKSTRCSLRNHRQRNLGDDGGVPREGVFFLNFSPDFSACRTTRVCRSRLYDDAGQIPVGTRRTPSGPRTSPRPSPTMTMATQTLMQ